MERVNEIPVAGQKGGGHVPAQPLARGLEAAARAIRSKPFDPHPLFRGGHAQTIASSQHPVRLRDLRADRALYEQRHVEVEPDTRVLVECRWQTNRREAPTLLVMHGLEGSSESLYVRGTARKAYAAGFNVACLNMRTCGGTEHLSATLYHNGLTGDIHRVVKDLTEGEGLSKFFLAGFSMSGNMMLRLAGEYGDEAPAALAGVCAVSPSIDLAGCARRIESPSNLVYSMSFMRHLRGRLRRKSRLHPGVYNLRGLWRVRTIRQFDERFTAPHGGFRDAADYYERTSSLPVIPRIRVPTLILHSIDDPLIPVEPFNTPAVINNPSVLLVLTEHGGHVGFYAGRPPEGEDRHWAENRVIEFCRLIARGTNE